MSMNPGKRMEALVLTALQLAVLCSLALGRTRAQLSRALAVTYGEVRPSTLTATIESLRASSCLATDADGLMRPTLRGAAAASLGTTAASGSATSRSVPVPAGVGADPDPARFHMVDDPAQGDEWHPYGWMPGYCKVIKRYYYRAPGMKTCCCGHLLYRGESICRPD